MRKPTPLKQAIFAAGLKQKDIAAEIGVSEVTLSRIVNGLHAPDRTRAKIADALGKTVEDLWPDNDRAAA